MEEVLQMSIKELERYRVLTAIAEGQITQIAGAKLLNLSTRQVRTLFKELRNLWA